MGFLTNSWVRYFDRTYQQIKAHVITDLAALTPEMTDHNDTNPYIKCISIWSGIAEMLGYYIDNAAREAFIDTCRRYASGVKIARLMDYKILSCTAASADITFTISTTYGSNITIPAGVLLSTANGIQFITTASGVIISGTTSVIIPAIQVTSVSNSPIAVSTGLAGQSIILGTNIVNDSVAIRISSVNWTSTDTFGFSVPTDQVYIQTVDENQNTIIKFGDGDSGAIPAASVTIFADYQTTLGAAGNVANSAIININSSLTLPSGITCTAVNLNAASGGGGVESLDDLRKHIPIANRTLMRAVTKYDYPDVAELCAGVIKAGLDFNCGKTVDIYVVPTGGGIASGTLLTTVLNWFEDKRMVTTLVRPFPAGQVHIILNIDITILPQYQRSVVVAAVTQNLLNWLAFNNQQIGGYVKLSDIYQVVEDTEGINFSTINQMTSQSYARPLDQTTPQLAWTRVTNSTSVGTNVYKILMLSSTTFQVIRNGSYVLTGTVGTQVVLNDITFTVNSGTYVLGNQWQFVTYDYFGSINLAEPSLAVANSGDITINPTGGI